MARAYRANGKRGPAEYVGAGVVGDIWADPGRKNAWYCAVENYERFPFPVPAKVQGANREDIPKNLWRDGVRVLDPQVYDEIVREGTLRDRSVQSVPPPQRTQLAQPAQLILPAALAQHQELRSGYRRSPRSKAIGDWAEKAALAYIEGQIAGCTNCTHRAALGETPGWDIDYCDGRGQLQRVEVKGTVGGAFAGFELTANEMAAAKEHADQYWLCLVASCETDQPKIQFIQNPAEKITTGEWTTRPALYSVRFNAG